MKFEQVGTFKVTWQIALILNIIAGSVFFVGISAFFYLYLMYSNDMFAEKLLENSNIIISYAAVIAQVLFHEYSHAIGYKMKGGRVAYGIKWLCPYCRETTGVYYTSADFIITLVMPLITGTIVGVAAIILFPQYLYYTIIAMLTNISGASGDLFMLAYVAVKAGKQKYIRDEPFGFSIHQRKYA